METQYQKDGLTLLEANIKKLENDVIGYIKYLTNDATLALDLAQESMLRSLDILSNSKDISKLKPYVLKVARNLSIDHFRKKDSKHLELKESFIDREELQNVKTPEDLLLKKEEKKGVFDVFKTLKSKDKEILTLYYYNDLNVKQISDLIDIPLNTVITRLCRARRTLKGKIGRS